MRLNSDYLGSVQLLSASSIPAGTPSTVQMVYRVGKYGIDDRGSIRVVWRNVSDFQIPQFDHPEQDAYATVTSNGSAELTAAFTPYERPFLNGIRISVNNGFLKEGDEVYITFGVTEYGGKGCQMQSFCEREHEFRVLVDPCGTGRCEPLPKHVVITVTPAEPAMYEIVAPSTVQPGEDFTAALRILDPYGNPTGAYTGTVRISVAENPELPAVLVNASAGHRGILTTESFRLEECGVFHLKAEFENGPTVYSNPCICSRQSQKLYWGDMHGQTKQTVGTGSLDDYFAFARDCGLISFTGWQGNDFEVSQQTWEDVRRTVREFQQDGKFLTFLGYEWSGITANGGDHNVYFLGDNEVFYPSSNWTARGDLDVSLNANPIPELWEKVAGRKDVMLIPHIGGRYANLEYFNPDFTPVIEVHSHHGIFDWFALDAMKRRLKVGFIATSDDHTCRPGMSYPLNGKGKSSSQSFTVPSGLTGVFLPELSKEAVWDALFQRRCYASTQKRLFAEVYAAGGFMGQELTAPSGPCEIQLMVSAQSRMDRAVLYDWDQPVEEIDFLPKCTNAVRITWTGVTRRGRSKTAAWSGEISVDGGRITSAVPCGMPVYCGLTPELVDDRTIRFQQSTSGERKGVELALEGSASFRIHTNFGDASFTLSEVREKQRLCFPMGGENRMLTVELANIPARDETEYLRQCTARISMTRNLQAGSHALWFRAETESNDIVWTSPVFISCD